MIGAATNMGGTGSGARSLVQSQGLMFASNVEVTGVFMLSVSSGAAVANPTALIGLTAVNGAAATAMRSDGAPALDQAIAPTWSGVHTFAAALSAMTAGVVLASGSPAIIFNETDTTANARAWRISANAGSMLVSLTDDAGLNPRNYLRFNRVLAAAAAIQFGNATDNPTYDFLGTGLTTHSGPMVMRAPSGGRKASARSTRPGSSSTASP